MEKKACPWEPLTNTEKSRYGIESKYRSSNLVDLWLRASSHICWPVFQTEDARNAGKDTAQLRPETGLSSSPLLLKRLAIFIPRQGSLLLSFLRVSLDETPQPDPLDNAGAEVSTTPNTRRSSHHDYLDNPKHQPISLKWSAVLSSDRNDQDFAQESFALGFRRVS